MRIVRAFRTLITRGAHAARAEGSLLSITTSRIRSHDAAYARGREREAPLRLLETSSMGRVGYRRHTPPPAHAPRLDEGCPRGLVAKTIATGATFP